jgi:putative ABC transport system substrate-binding protein
MAAGGDVLATGLVESLAHPGGNITGQMFFSSELCAKRLAILKEVAPALGSVGVLMRRTNPSNAHIIDVMSSVAKALKVTLRPIEVGDVDDIQRGISAVADARIAGLVTTDTRILINNAALIADARRNMAVIGFVELAEKGGLVGYGVNFAEMYRRAAYFVDKILKGAKPGDLPIEQATKFETIVNLKTAKALGLDNPPTLLAAADEVIE